MGIKALNVGELINLLKEYNPSDEVLFINTTTNRAGHIVGLDEKAMLVKHCVVLELIADDVIGKVKEIEDRVAIQKRQLDEMLATLDKKQLKYELEKAMKDPKYFTKKGVPKYKQGIWVPTAEKKSPIELLASGYIPTGKAGRPRKIHDLPRTLNEMLKPEKLNEMTPVELAELMKRITYELDRQKLKKR